MELGDCSLWHHLIFCDELASDAASDVVCEFCKEPIFECPAYKCLECNFLIHASCVQMYWRHPKKHHLIYVEEGENEYVCVGCGEPASGPTYKCAFSSGCSFLVHKSCTHFSYVTRHHHAEQPDHISTLQFRYWERCQVCGDREWASLFYGCRICDITIHERCFFRLQIGAEGHHQHTLRPIPFTCQACGGNEREGRAYVCAGCGVLTHRECAKFPHTIKVSFHGHSLTRTYFISRVKKQNHIFCNFCYKKVNIEGGAYYCRQCDYIVHMECAKDWEDERKDETALTNFNEYKAHMVHLVEGLNGREGETTSPSKISHFSHQQHELILNYEEEPLDEKRYEACMLLIIFPPFYSCQHCSFFLHCKCAKLPLTITRGLLHRHPLTVITREPSTELFQCLFCRHIGQGFAYARKAGCRWVKLDVQCLFIPEKLNHESHTHHLLHLFKLTYGREDDSKVYYCFICEKERDPNVWFYYCEECDFAAHIQCILGKHPHIKFGNTLHKENYQHPLKFVQKIEDLATCALCDKEFRENVALECSQRNIQIHYDCNNIDEF